jgi:hypothetical protein
MQPLIFAIAAVVLSALAGGLGQILVARRMPFDVREPINEVGGVLYAAVVGAFGVLLAFVISVVWGQFDGAKQTAEQEANLLAGIYLEAGAFAAPDRQQIQGDVREYIDRVVQQEWTSMGPETRAESPAAHRALRKLWADALAVKIPADDPKQPVAYDHVLEHLHEATSLRHLRLLAARDAIHNGLWAVLGLGTAMTVAFAWFFGVRGKSGWAHPLMVGGLSAFISACLVVVAVLDHPFGGYFGIRPEAFTRARETCDDASGVKP